MEQFYENKSVLIAGGTGFIGRNLINKLCDFGAKVTATHFTKNIPISRENLNFLRVDLTDYDACLKATKGIDYVFMLAANTSGAAVIEKEPLAHLTPNVVMNSEKYCPYPSLATSEIGKGEVSNIMLIATAPAIPPKI